MTTTEESQRRMRFFRFSLRQLFVLVVAVAALVSVFVPDWQKQRREYQRAEASRRLLTAAAQGDADGTARALAAGADLRVCGEATGRLLPGSGARGDKRRYLSCSPGDLPTQGHTAVEVGRPGEGG